MTKRLRKEIMVRSKSRNKFNNSRTRVNLQNYRKQRKANKCTKVLRNAKQQYFNNLSCKKVLWSLKNSARPSNKSKTANTIILHENNNNQIKRKYHILWTNTSQIW